MSKIVEMDELDVGMFLTVLQGATERRLARGPNGSGIPQIKEDKRLNGKILRVTAVDLPYVAVEFFYLSTNKTIKTDTLDAREVVLGSITYDFINAAEPRWADTPRHQVSDIDWSFEDWQEQEVYVKE